MIAIFGIAVAFAAISIALYSAPRARPRIIDARTEGSDGGAFPRWPYFRIALGIRIAAATLIRATGLSDFFAPDRNGYEAGGAALAERWWGDHLSSVGRVVRAYSGDVNFYHYANGVSYFLGTGPSAILLANCLLGALVPGLVASITSRLGGNRSACLKAALLAALFPSLVIWSSINIRDVWAMAAILFALDSALAVRERLSPPRFAVFVGAMVLLGLLRGYMFVLVAVGLGLSVIATISINRFRGFAAALLTAAVCFYVYSVSGFGKRWVQDASLERVAAIREGMTGGASSAYLVGADVSTAAGATKFLPLGLAYFWLSPFPWSIRNLRQSLAIPEVLFFYWLIPIIITGARTALRERFGRAATLLSVVAIVSIAYALVEGNYGTAYRHRAQVLAPLLAVAGIGLAERRRIQSSTAGSTFVPADIPVGGLPEGP